MAKTRVDFRKTGIIEEIGFFGGGKKTVDEKQAAKKTTPKKTTPKKTTK